MVSHVTVSGVWEGRGKVSHVSVSGDWMDKGNGVTCNSFWALEGNGKRCHM